MLIRIDLIIYYKSVKECFLPKYSLNHVLSSPMVALCVLYSKQIYHALRGSSWNYGFRGGRNSTIFWGAQPRRKWCYFCHRGIHNFTSGSKECMIYLLYIPPTNILVGNSAEAAILLFVYDCRADDVPRWTRFTQWSMKPIPIALFTHYRWKTIDRSHICDDIDGIVHYSINVVTV